MKKSPQLISTSPIVLSPFLDVLTNPLLFRERGPVHDSENIQRSIDAVIVEFSLDYRSRHLPRKIQIQERNRGWWLYYVPFQSGWESRFRKVSLMNDGGVGFHDAEAKIRDLNSSIDSRARSLLTTRTATRIAIARNTRVYANYAAAFIHRARPASSVTRFFILVFPCLPTGMLTFPLLYRSNILFLILIAITNRPVTSSELQIKEN